jgi:hypothetical protein
MENAHHAVALLNSVRRGKSFWMEEVKNELAQITRLRELVGIKPPTVDDKPSGFQGKYLIVDEHIDCIRVEQRVFAHMQASGFSFDEVRGSLTQLHSHRHAEPTVIPPELRKSIALHLSKDQTHAQ